MSSHEPIKRAGAIDKAERKLLRFFNHKSGGGIIAASFLTLGTGMTAIVSMADKVESTHQTAAAAVTTQQFRQEAAQISRDIRSIKLIESEQGLRVAPQDEKRVAAINTRMQNLTARVAFNTDISEAAVAGVMGDLLHDSYRISENYNLHLNPVVAEPTIKNIRRLMNRAAYRDEALADFGNKPATQHNLTQLVLEMGYREGNRLDWVAAAIFLGLPVGGTGLIMGAQRVALRRQRKTDQEERTEISYDTMQDIKKKMTPKTTVRVSYGKQP